MFSTKTLRFLPLALFLLTSLHVSAGPKTTGMSSEDIYIVNHEHQAATRIQSRVRGMFARSRMRLEGIRHERRRSNGRPTGPYLPNGMQLDFSGRITTAYSASHNHSSADFSGATLSSSHAAYIYSLADFTDGSLSSDTVEPGAEYALVPIPGEVHRLSALFNPLNAPSHVGAIPRAIADNNSFNAILDALDSLHHSLEPADLNAPYRVQGLPVTPYNTAAFLQRKPLE
jgi:hypothetical protein